LNYSNFEQRSITGNSFEGIPKAMPLCPHELAFLGSPVYWAPFGDIKKDLVKANKPPKSGDQ
jgi:hypothetical protein